MQIEDTRPRWGLLIGVILLLGILASLPFFLLKPKETIPFEIKNFLGSAEIYSPSQKRWIPLTRGKTLGLREKIRTGEKGEVDLQIPDQIQLRLKKNSQLEGRGPKFLEKELTFRLHLLRGRLIGSTQKKFQNRKLEVLTPVLVAAVRGTEFQVESNPEKQEATVGVLRGIVEVRSIKARKSVTVRGLERTGVKGRGAPTIPIRITRQEWDQLKEAYELIGKSAFLEARQLDLSKEAGTLFQFVFDHGTFYTPQFGFAEREFIKDETTGKVHLKVDYDVFPVGVVVGVYIKIRDLDLFQFKSLSFQARGDADEGFPESFRVELKTKEGITRLFTPRDLKATWQDFQFPLTVTKPTPISEMTLVFSNEKAGEHKKGTVYFKELNLEPKTEEDLKATPPSGTTQPSV
ncbi:MAG: FecR domain-containing protein [Candidatus Omnitrophica bacterium]|nr:FecR domain-containing protein [Candidatus Omnitrophota bacterium]